MADDEQYNVSRPYHREGDAFVFDKPSSDGDRHREKRENEQHEFARDQVATNRRLAWFTGLLVVGTFIGTGISIWQATIAQTSANAARDAVKVARDTLNESRADSIDQRQQVAQSRTDSQNAANDSRRAANLALQATIENFRQEQRAWVGITSISMTSEGISVRLINSGHVATTLTTTVDRMVANVIMSKDTPFGATESLYVYGGGGAKLPPNGYYDITIPVNDLPEDEMIGLRSNRRVIYIRGNVRFSTGFGNMDDLPFCFIWNPSHPFFNSCPPLHAQMLKDKGQDVEDKPKAK